MTHIKADTMWLLSGHEDVFKFILKDLTLNEAKGVFYESGDFDRLIRVACFGLS